MVPLRRGRFGSREWRFLAASALPLRGGHGNASKDCKAEHVDNAQNIKKCLERSSLPNLFEEGWKKNLQFIVTADGPAAAEFSAESHELANEELAKRNQDAGKHVNISLTEAGGLTMFDRKNTQFTEEKFKQYGDLKTNFKVSDKDRTLTNPATEFGGHPILINSMKQVDNAQNIRKCPERASLPNLSEEERKKNLQFIVTADGPTGAEFSAESHDFANEELAKLNLDAGKHVNISLIEAGGLTITLTNPETEFGGHPILINSMKIQCYKNPVLPRLARRCFSSKSDPEDQKFSWEPVCTKGFHGLGRGDTRMFLNNLEIDKMELRSDLDIGLLKAEFERDFRPLLAHNFLLLPGTLSHGRAAYLHKPLHGIMNHVPLYLSSLDIMVRMKGLKESQRKPLIDHIIQGRVLVAEDWKNSYGNIELLEYDFRESNTSFVRGECDAAFEQIQKPVGTRKVCGTGKISIIIWKEDQLLWAEVFKGIPCSEVNAAEVHAALALLKKCEEMKFVNVELWSDSEVVCGVLSGELTIGMNDPDRDMYLVLRSMQTKFSKLVTVLKPRELMFLADKLLKMDSNEDLEVKAAIKSWLPALRGSALFRITRNRWTSSIIKSFASKRAKMEAQGYIYSPESTFYLKVLKEKKLEVLQKLMAFLSPISVEVLVDAYEKKPPLLQSQLHDMFDGISSWTASGRIKSFGQRVPNQSQRNLVVVLDACTPSADYNVLDSCVIIMAEEDEVKDMRRRRISEINVESYLYFNRGEINKPVVR